MQVTGNAMWILQQKLKALGRRLSEWSRNEVGDIFAKIEEWEAKNLEMEELDEVENTDESREKANAEYVRWLSNQESFLKQKTHVRWFEEGDCNTRYFHNCIRERRGKLQIHRIKNSRGHWVKGDDKIGKAAVKYFKKMFNLPPAVMDEALLEYIPKVISDQENQMLCEVPNEEEIRMAVFDMCSSSSPGPDGFTGLFYQKSWSIIKKEVVQFVQCFFMGKKLTGFFSHTGLVLIPKIESPVTFADLRPISLSNVSAKIISKVLSRRLNPLLGKLISENQSGFVQGRSITDNILLAQEIIQGISQENKGGNIVIKLDMAKAYDRLSWQFLLAVLKKFGFSNEWVDIIWRLVSEVWYSITVNGDRHGFFTSSQGLKQGDPLSPSLFIIAAEVLSRMLNELIKNENFEPFSMNRKGPVINHLAYADDIVIFTSGRRKSVKHIMKQIRKYEKSSGQLVNEQKSFFCTDSKASTSRINKVIDYTGYKNRSFPFSYLGCPLYIGRKKPMYFDELVAKIAKRISGWNGKYLTFGGKVTLIKHVLQAVPIYTFSSLNPPKSTLKLIERHLTRFFWGSTEEKARYHWASWANLTYPKEEGGVGLKKMVDICEGYTFKRWWKFRTQESLWSKFLKVKYCSRMHPVAKANASKQSHAWGSMMKIRAKAEENICWAIQKGDANLWWDNWTHKGALAHLVPGQSSAAKLKVASIIQEGGWDMEQVNEMFPPEVAEIISNIHIGNNQQGDYAIWKPGYNGSFTTKSTFQSLSQHRQKRSMLNNVWYKNLPFKMSFLVWRLMQRKLPFDDILISKFGFSATSVCVCCQQKQRDTLQHCFLNSEVAIALWKSFGRPMGIDLNQEDVLQNFWNWWKLKPRNEIHKLIIYTVPVLICWEIWRQRCSCKYGTQKRMNARSMGHQVLRNVKMLMKKAFPTFQPAETWIEICGNIERMRCVKTCQTIKWTKPEEGRVKLNTDGSFCRDKAGTGGMLRDSEGKFLMAFSKPITCSSNNLAEAMAAKTGLRWCLDNGFTNCDLEMDSKLIVDMLRNGGTANLRLKATIEEILHLMQRMHCNVQHCFREGNFVADTLAKEAANLAAPTFFYSWQSLPREVKGYYHLDKSQLPSLRLRI